MVRSAYEKINVKRGAWTTEEDTKKLSFGSKHGSGLKRCAKSCRLRWANCPSPDLKHNNFSTQEEELIIKLHAAIGSRWSIIAQQLSGKTDVDVKNYWNSKLKKKLSQMGIDPVTHKSFSKLIADYGNIGGSQKLPSNRTGSINKDLKNAMMLKSESNQTLPHEFTNINNQTKLSAKMNRARNNFLYNRTHNDNLSMDLDQFQTIQTVLDASHCINLENETIPTCVLREDCLSKTSSPSTPSTYSTSTSSWNDFLLEEAFTPLDDQEQDIMVSKCLVSQIENVARQSWNKKIMSQQPSSSAFQFSPSSEVSFMEAMLDQENDMFLSFPHLME